MLLIIMCFPSNDHVYVWNNDADAINEDTDMKWYYPQWWVTVYVAGQPIKMVMCWACLPWNNHSSRAPAVPGRRKATWQGGWARPHPKWPAMAVVQLTWAQHGWYSIFWRSRQGRHDQTKCPPFKWKVGVVRHALAERSIFSEGQVVWPCVCQHRCIVDSHLVHQIW